MCFMLAVGFVVIGLDGCANGSKICVDTGKRFDL